MQERSEEQIISRLFELENGGQAERRTELSEERYLSLINDPDRSRAYVFQRGGASGHRVLGVPHPG